MTWDDLVNNLNNRTGFEEGEGLEAVATIPYDKLVELIEGYLIETGQLGTDAFIYDMDLALPINDDGEVEFDIEFKPGGPMGNN